MSLATFRINVPFALPFKGSRVVIYTIILLISFLHFYVHRFTVKELIKSEKEYVARLNYAMLHYLPVIFESMAPRALRSQKDTLLGNLDKIWEFHSK